LTDDDRELVARFLAARDEDAFRRLYRRHTPALYLLALRLLGPYSTAADDVVQEIWVRASRSLGQFEWTSSLRTWLCGIVVNRCREVRRSGGRREAALAAWALIQTPASGWTSESFAVERAVAGLADDLRDVLVLHDVHGYTHREIGTMLGISAGTSKSRLHDARLAIRTELRPAPAGMSAHERRR
jgi:RNA polymerase sigma-70 factor (ECF subfamily)